MCQRSCGAFAISFDFVRKTGIHSIPVCGVQIIVNKRKRARHGEIVNLISGNTNVYTKMQEQIFNMKEKMAKC